MNSVGGLAARILNRLRRAYYAPNAWMRARESRPPFPLVRLGSGYGGWHVCDDPRLEGAAAILCGAGEDITFDLAVQARYGMAVAIVDPTPRAIAHMEQLRAAAADGRTIPVNNTDVSYDLAGVDLSRVRFMPVAVWSEDATLRFWAPANPDHVSHSAVNLQGTSESIEVPALSITTLAADAGGDADVELLKLDVEGAECAVIEALLASTVRPSQLLIEFDEFQFPTRERIAKVKSTVDRLLSAGYILAHFDGAANCLFYRPM